MAKAKTTAIAKAKINLPVDVNAAMQAEMEQIQKRISAPSGDRRRALTPVADGDRILAASRGGDRHAHRRTRLAAGARRVGAGSDQRTNGKGDELDVGSCSAAPHQLEGVGRAGLAVSGATARLGRPPAKQPGGGDFDQCVPGITQVDKRCGPGGGGAAGQGQSRLSTGGQREYPAAGRCRFGWRRNRWELIVWGLVV